MTFRARQFNVPACERVGGFRVVETGDRPLSLTGVARRAVTVQLPAVLIRMTIETGLVQSEKSTAHVHLIAEPGQIFSYEARLVAVAAPETGVLAL
jgi:hypothetical protein